jgi:spartin
VIWDHSLDHISDTDRHFSTGISRGATLLASGITTASNFYVSRATPHPSAAPAREGIASPPPPLAVQWLTSDPARRGLDTAHTYTGKAAALSKRTLDAVEGVVARAFAPSKGKGRAVPLPPHPDRGPPLMFDPNLPDSSAEKAPARPSSAQLGMSPPPYTMSGAPPALPPRKGAASAPSTPRTATPPLSDPKPESRLGKKARLVLSAQLVISTLEASSKRLGAAGADAFTGAVAHKYGPVAAQSARALTGTARNVALVYVDVAGFGRRALLKRAGKAIVKARINGHTYALTTDERGQVTEVAPASPTIETATVPGEKRPF